MTPMTRTVVLAVALGVSNVGAASADARAATIDETAVITNYASIAHAMYQDAHAGAVALKAAVDALVTQTRAVERVVAALDLQIRIEGSHSLDYPVAVGKN